MKERMVFLVNSSKGEISCKKVENKELENPSKDKLCNSTNLKEESKQVLTNLLKDNAINDIIDYNVIQKITSEVSNINISSRNANEVFSCIHVIDEALKEIEELLEYIKRLISTACESVMLENDWKELNTRIDNMILEIDKITKRMVEEVNYFLKLC